MNALELKTNLHSIVDKMQNEHVLQSLYDFLKTKENSKNGELCASLSHDQREEVLKAFDESEVEADLIESDLVFRKNS